VEKQTIQNIESQCFVFWLAHIILMNTDPFHEANLGLSKGYGKKNIIFHFKNLNFCAIPFSIHTG